MRVANSCLIWKLWVKRGTIDVPGSLVVIKMRDGSTSVGLSRETTSGFAGELGQRNLDKQSFVGVQILKCAMESTEECELVLWKEHQGHIIEMRWGRTVGQLMGE
jgi:hypothetical protein